MDIGLGKSEKYDALNDNPQLLETVHLPEIDISDHSKFTDCFIQKSVVDKRDGVYLGQPTTALLSDGKTIICVYPSAGKDTKGNPQDGHGNGPILMSVSTNEGRTWSSHPVPNNWKDSKECPIIYNIPLSTGEDRLVLWSGNKPLNYDISAGGFTGWSGLKHLLDGKGNPRGGFMPFTSFLQMDKEDLDLYQGYDSANGNLNRIVFRFDASSLVNAGNREVKLSKDDFRGGQLGRFSEPCVIRNPNDWDHLKVIIRISSRKSESLFSESRNNGMTWTSPREISMRLSGDRHVAKTLPDGRIIISYRKWNAANRSQTAHFNNHWVAWIGKFDEIDHNTRGDCLLKLAHNYPRSYGNRETWDCGYPGIVVLPDNSIVLTSYGHWEKKGKPYIISLRMSIPLQKLTRLV